MKTTDSDGDDVTLNVDVYQSGQSTVAQVMGSTDTEATVSGAGTVSFTHSTNNSSQVALVAYAVDTNDGWLTQIRSVEPSNTSSHSS
jgi:hypothetical protein